jgi:hypothetical protein
MVTAASAPLAVVAMRAPWHFPWYCGIPIVAAEILAVFASGFLCSLLLMVPLCLNNRCRECGGKMSMNGSHFDLAGDRLPTRTDIAMIGLFVAMNIAFWIAYERSKIGG